MGVPGAKRWRDSWTDVRRSFTDFLAVPSATVAAFVLLAGGIYALDRTSVAWLEPVREALRARLVTDPDSTRALLGTIAGAVITVTSITFSLLLLAVQQSAAALTAQVLDQFLHRRVNQFYFGVFVGIALFTLLTLATLERGVPPVFGATAALLMALVALIVLVLLLYTTLNQIRPDRIVEAIHDLTLAARVRQLQVIGRTRRAPAFAGPRSTVAVRAANNGYVASIDLRRLERAVAAARGEVEVDLSVSLGAYVCFRDVVAELKLAVDGDGEAVSRAVLGALALERQRSLHGDPSYGVFQLSTIAWTSVSTAKSNPAPGLAGVRALRDLLARWSDEGAPGPADMGAPLPVVYRDDLLELVLGALESVAVVSSESMQHQSCAEVMTTFALMYDRLPADARPRAEDAIRRIVSSLGDHVLTADLDAALTRLTDTLERSRRPEVAAAVRRAHVALGESVGRLNSRGTRVPHRA